MSNIRELSQLAASIVVDDSTRNIGIGTSTPSSKLSVSGDLNVSGVITATSFYGDGSNLSGISIVGLASEGYVDNLVAISTFSGDYNDLTNTPSNLSSFSNDVGFVTFTNTSQLNNDSGYITGVSTFSGDYNDLINTPNIPSIVGLASEGYVDSSIANLVDAAPGALDTLNELAAALGDDSNFSTTVTNSLASKANLTGANFTGVVTATSFYGDGSNLSNIISGVGIQSAGSIVGSGVTILNFIGVGNTFAVNGTTVDISIAGGGGGGSSVSISTTPPTNPTEGDLWYSSILGRTFIYYVDEDSSQWVDSAPFNPVEPSSTPGKTSSSFTATQGQTTFEVSYTAGYIDVFLNGIRLNSTEYIANNGTSVILVQGASSGDVLDVVEFRMGIGATGPAGIDGSGGPLNNVTTSTSSSTHYPLFTIGAGSTLPYITTTNDYFEFTPSSGTLNVNQLVVSGVTTSSDFDSLSDINFKENIHIIDNPLEKIIGISGVTFNWKESKKTSAGVIAQDVEKVFPEVVSTNDTTKAVNYNGLIGLLIEVVKEQQCQINTLTKRIEKLEGQ